MYPALIRSPSASLSESTCTHLPVEPVGRMYRVEGVMTSSRLLWELTSGGTVSVIEPSCSAKEKAPVPENWSVLPSTVIVTEVATWALSIFIEAAPAERTAATGFAATETASPEPEQAPRVSAPASAAAARPARVGARAPVTRFTSAAVAAVLVIAVTPPVATPCAVVWFGTSVVNCK